MRGWRPELIIFEEDISVTQGYPHHKLTCTVLLRAVTAVVAALGISFAVPENTGRRKTICCVISREGIKQKSYLEHQIHIP